jgi:hypothetical protein
MWPAMLVGHDEFNIGGIDGPIGALGGGLTFCQQRDAATRGTYVSEAPCLYGIGSRVLTLMDNRVSSAIEHTLYSVAWTMIQGADIVQNGVLDPDIAEAMASKMRAGILTSYEKEIANPSDPNLVVVDPNVTVDPPFVTISVAVNDDLFDYVNGIDITVENNRS